MPDETTADKYARGSGVPHPVDIHVGQRLRERRALCGLSQKQLATSLDKTYQQLQKYECGYNRVAASTLYEISRALGVQEQYFFEDFSPDKSVPVIQPPAHAPPPPSWVNIYYQLSPQQRKIAYKIIRHLVEHPDS